MLSFAARATGGMIHTYDKEKDTEYCETLYQYLNCSLSIKRPAMSFLQSVILCFTGYLYISLPAGMEDTG